MDPYLSLHHLFRRLQIKNRFIQQLPEVSLSPLEVHLLIELQAKRDHTITSLAKLLLVHQSTVSRTVAALIKRGYLESEAEKQSRNRTLRLTEKAVGAIADIDLVTSKRIAEWSHDLSKAEFSTLVEFMRDTADGLQAPPCDPRPRENPYRVEQRRLTRAFGLLGENVFGSSLTSLEWHILGFAILNSHKVQPSELSRYFSLPHNTISTALTRLGRRGLLVREPDPQDGRKMFFPVTEKGEKTWKEIEHRATSQLKHALSSVTRAKLLRGVEIAGRFIDGTAVQNLFPLPQDHKFRRLLKPEEINAARAWAITEVVARGHQKFIGPSLLSSSSVIYELATDDERLAVAEITKVPGGMTLSFAAWSDQIFNNELWSFISLARGAAHSKNVSISFPPLAEK